MTVILQSRKNLFNRLVFCAFYFSLFFCIADGSDIDLVVFSFSLKKKKFKLEEQLKLVSPFVNLSTVNKAWPSDDKSYIFIIPNRRTNKIKIKSEKKPETRSRAHTNLCFSTFFIVFFVHISIKNIIKA